MQIDQYVRKPFFVEAVQVTSENIDEVSAWCGGEIAKTIKSGASYIKVPVSDPLTIRHTKAFADDWVLKSNKDTFKIYTDRAFVRMFERSQVVTMGASSANSSE